MFDTPPAAVRQPVVAAEKRRRMSVARLGRQFGPWRAAAAYRGVDMRPSFDAGIGRERGHGHEQGNELELEHGHGLVGGAWPKSWLGHGSSGSDRTGPVRTRRTDRQAAAGDRSLILVP